MKHYHLLVVMATISLGDKEIEVTLHCDGGCEASDLVLHPNDVRSLDLTPTGDVLKARQVDGSIVHMIEYDRVLIRITFSDGVVVTAKVDVHIPSVTPTGSTSPSPDGQHVVEAPLDTDRILGYGGLTRLSLKQDFKQNNIEIFRNIELEYQI